MRTFVIRNRIITQLRLPLAFFVLTLMALCVVQATLAHNARNPITLTSLSVNSSISIMSESMTAVAGDNKVKSKNREKAKSAKDDDDLKDKSSKKSDKLVKSKKQDDDDGDDDDDAVTTTAILKNRSDKKSNEIDKGKAEISEASSRGITSAADRVKDASASEVSAEGVTKGLSAQARYISMGEAIKRAKAEGGTGDLLKVDLEWDEYRSTVTWDLTFSSGNEYEIDALSGKSLGTKTKGVVKLAKLTPLELNARGLLTFQEIIRKAELMRGQSVMEMELKHFKGRAETIYELAMDDGTTIYYNASTGQPVKGI